MSGTQTISTDLSETDIEELLAHPSRRYLLYYLHRYANPVQLADVAHQITIWKLNEPADEHLQERLQIYLALYHDHLPPLAEADVVDYAQQEDMIELGPTAEQLIPALERNFRDEVVDLLEAEHCTFDRSQ
ncbi:DUF7344 domain-containing protein [Natrinema amylolyticum]|uniref:DUF7344 domain-containing protein n=1 Tax=Natrinema amylolyticum TaxID=2878679 RepID=UPI001CFAF080|nr:hypothetical protein [Natrinema amylolyticum]